MDSRQYDSGRRTAQQLEYKIRDFIDAPAHPISQSLINESRAIEDDFQTHKNPRSIEDRIKRIVQKFEELRRHETEVMDAQHARWLHDQYEDLQMSLRKFENY